jgi:hypothetical protein
MGDLAGHVADRELRQGALVLAGHVGVLAIRADRSPLGTPAVATILGDLGVSFPVAGLRVYCETAPAVLDRLSTA